MKKALHSMYAMHINFNESMYTVVCSDRFRESATELLFQIVEHGWDTGQRIEQSFVCK